MAHVLVVEDDEHIRMLIRDVLALGGHTAALAEDGKEAEEFLKQETFDLGLFDVMLPEEDGFALMKKVHDFPVIFVSALSTVDDKVRGLKLGAEDYIVKPFEPLELLARIDVVLRRTGRGKDILTYENIVLNEKEHTVTQNGEEVLLAPKEFDLLRLFISHPGIVFTKDKLLSLVWGYSYAVETRTVDIHIQRLRKKMHLQDDLITIPRVGYKLEKKP